MDNLLKIRLRALNIDLKHDREYRIILGQDLFSNWYVVVMFGKYGTWGRNKTTYFNTREEAYNFIDNRLKRRLSSPKRIGCSYQIVSFDGDGEIVQNLNKSVIERFSWFKMPQIKAELPARQFKGF